MYDVRAAQLGVDIAAEDARNLEQRVALQVWSSYYALAVIELGEAVAREVARDSAGR